jgi:hypothetical protein
MPSCYQQTCPVAQGCGVDFVQRRKRPSLSARFGDWVGILAVIFIPACSSSHNAEKYRTGVGTCDPTTSNIAVSGFANTPVTVSGVVPQTDVRWDNGEFTGVNFFMKGSTIAMRVILVSDHGTSFAAGDKVAVGDDPVLQLEGAGPVGNYYFCEATSGEVNVDVLSVVPGSLPVTLGAARLSFDASCATDSAEPAGTTHVSGCFNYPGL